MCLTVRLGSPMKETITINQLQIFLFFLILICITCPFSSSLPFGCTSPIFCFDTELSAFQFTFFSVIGFLNISIILHCFPPELVSFIFSVTSTPFFWPIYSVCSPVFPSTICPCITLLLLVCYHAPICR